MREAFHSGSFRFARESRGQRARRLLFVPRSRWRHRYLHGDLSDLSTVWFTSERIKPEPKNSENFAQALGRRTNICLDRVLSSYE